MRVERGMMERESGPEARDLVEVAETYSMGYRRAVCT
jgi:hypothetical protein